MTYCARFGSFKLCNYRRKSGLVACDAHSDEIPKSSYPEGVNHFPQSYISQLHRTTMRHGSVAGGVKSITTSAGQLYDLSMDPFELNNLWDKSEFKDKQLEIRKWAESEIGLPEVPVVGAGKCFRIDRKFCY